MSSSLRVIVVLAFATAAAYLAARMAGGFCGVGDRWLEVGGTYTAKELASWVESDQARAGRYAFPVLVPLDLVFLVLLGATLAVTSVVLAGSVRGLESLVWTFVLLPALFVAADLAEDGLLVAMLLRAVSITEDLGGVVRAVTFIKLWTLKLAMAQTAVLGLTAWFWRR